jgi:hypothetical protein
MPRYAGMIFARSTLQERNKGHRDLQCPQLILPEDTDPSLGFCFHRRLP